MTGVIVIGYQWQGNFHIEKTILLLISYGTYIHTANSGLKSLKK